MSTIKCPKCGFENGEDNVYCAECGNSLDNGLLSKIKNFFSPNNPRIFKDYKNKRFRIQQFNKKYSIDSNPNEYITDSSKDILSKNEDIYNNLYRFKKLKLNPNDYELLDTFQETYNTLDYCIKQLNKKFLKDYYSKNKNEINNFLNIDGFITDYKSVLRNYAPLYENLSKIDNPSNDIKEFIKQYDNFEEVSKEINEKYIDEHLNFDKIAKFIDNYTININYSLLIKRDEVLNDYSEEYELVKKFEDPDEEIREFIRIYENFDNISNTEIERRNSVSSNFLKNNKKIENFIEMCNNPKEDLYIEDNSVILNKYKNCYDICLQLNEFDDNEISKKFTSLYENFEEVSKEINEKYIVEHLNFDKIAKFIDNYTINIDYSLLIKRDEVLNDYSEEYVLVKKFEEPDEEIREFIRIYENFDNFSNVINIEIERRNSVYSNFLKNNKEIENFIEMCNNPKEDLYIEDNSVILNKYKNCYDICLQLNEFDDNGISKKFTSLYENFDDISKQINEKYIIRLNQKFINIKPEMNGFIESYSTNISYDKFISTSEKNNILNNYSKHYNIVLDLIRLDDSGSDKKLINEFIDIYENFENISLDINKKFIDNKYNVYLESENKIKNFIDMFTINISHDEVITRSKKDKILKDYKSDYDLCIFLKDYKDNVIINEFTRIYSNFDEIVSKINKEVNILKEFNKVKKTIFLFIDKYQTNISDNLFIPDYNVVLNENKEYFQISNEVCKFSEDTAASQFIKVYENFKEISFKINKNFSSKKYDDFIKNKELIQNQLDKFDDLTIEKYISNKDSFINDFSNIYTKSKEILDYNKYLNLSNKDLKFIYNFIDLYDNFDVKFVEEFKNRYFEIEFEIFDFINTYRFDGICLDYIHNENRILKKYESNYNLLCDIKKLEEIDFDVDDFVYYYENFESIVKKINICFIKRAVNEFNLNKTDLNSFIYHFQNIEGYISDRKILEVYKDNYNKLKKLSKVPKIDEYLKEDFNLLKKFISFYENYDEIILEHNIEYVNNYYNQYKLQIREYVDILNNNHDYYLSNSRLCQLKDNFKSINKVVNNIRNYQKDYNYLDDTKLIDKFPKNFNLTENKITQINEKYIERELKNNKDFFDTILKHPLDDNQRRAVVIDEDNTQIIAGAGTGKTYTLQAKIKYLVEKKGISPDNILALSFSNLSVDDLKDQIDKIGVDIDISTFHSLGLSILRDNGVDAKVLDYGLKTAIRNYFSTYLLKNPEKIDEILKYFAYYIYTPLNMDEIENIGEVYDYENGYNLETFYSKFKKFKDPTLDKRTFQGEYVKSLEERMIANFLFLNGIKYVYETDYEPLINYQETRDYLFNFFNDDELPNDIIMEFVYRMLEELEIDEGIYWPNGDEVKSYHPDFYLKDHGIYYEHFGVNRNCEAPWYPNSKRERTYIQEMRNKRKLHKKYGTKLIETYSYYHSENRLLKRLEEKLKDENIEFNPIDAKSFLITLLSNENKMNEYYEFIKLIETFLSLFKGNGYKKAKFKEFRKINKNIFKDFVFEKHELFLSIAENIYDYYNEFLEENNAIDFNDMINDACGMILEKGYSKNYSYIIVDEYQDTSHTRYKLLKHVKDYYNANLIVVGDDWQSIYRFTGCDVDLFTNFGDYFTDTKTEICEITNTYRNSQSLIDISGNFIMKNDHQYKKQLVSKAPNQINGSIVLCQYLNKKDQPFLFEHIIKEIYNHSKNKNNVKILVLGRNNADYKAILHKNLFTTTGSTDNNNLKIIYHKNPKIKIKFLTVHGSKGLEENNVIVLNLEDKKAGFPNKMEDDSVLFFVKNEKDEGIAFAEERRLFYVALTRTRNYSFLFSPSINQSKFVEELIADNELVEFKFERMYEDYDDEDDQIRIISATEGICPECGTGKMVLKFNPKTGKSFFNCSNWSKCDWFGGRFFGEIEELEDVTLCPDCGGILLKRLNKYGEYFYGCINYYPDKICTFACNVEDVENPKYCPECGELIISGKSSFYHCTSDDCSFTCLVSKYEDIIKKYCRLNKEEIEDMMNKAEQLEKSNNYESAIKIYKEIGNNFEAYKRLCICYRKLVLFSDELNLIYKSIHNKSFDDKEKRFFKKRLIEFNFETKKSINKVKIIKSNKKCPECGKPIVLKINEKRNNIKYISCSNSECYWFGGVFEGDNKDFERYMI